MCQRLHSRCKTLGSSELQQNSESVGYRGDRAKGCAASGMAALRLRCSHVFVSPSLSQMALVPGTCPAPGGPLSASGPLACNRSGEEMHPPLYSLLKPWPAPHCLQLARPGLSVLVEARISALCTTVTERGRQGSPRKGGVLTPEEGKWTLGRPWHCRIKTQMCLSGASIPLPKPFIFL